MKDNAKSKVKKEKNHVLKNNIFALKLLFKMSPKLVIHGAGRRMTGYIEWLFYSAFYMRYLVTLLEGDAPFYKFVIFVGITAVFFCLVEFYHGYIDGYIKPVQTAKVNNGINLMLFKKAQNVELRCFEDTEFYNKYTLAMENADTRLIETVEVIWGVIFGAIASVASFYLLFSIDKWSVLFVIFPIIGNFVFNRKLGEIEFERNKDMAFHNRKSAYVNRVIYMREYSKEMRLTDALRLMLKRYEESLKGISEVTKKYKLKGAINHILRCSFTFSFIFEGMLIYGAYRTLVTGSMDMAELAVVAGMMVASTWILIGFADSCMTSFKNGLYVDNLRDFLDYKEKIPEDYDGSDAGSKIESIEFKNVSFKYDEKPVVENLSFKLEGNKTYALVGYNGAGKSTIIKLLMRFYDPDEGEILLNGHNIKEYNLSSYRNLFATAFQDHMLFSATVKENIMMRECTEEDDEKVIAALQKAGVYDKVMTLPKGIETVMTKEFDENGALLSGGESQKIVVARAFVSDSPFHIFDEPSSALDPIAEYELFDNIIKSGVDKTMLFISHRLSSVKDADKVLLLADGHVAEEGTHAELMALNGLYADMYEKQALNYHAITKEAWRGQNEKNNK